VRQDGFMHCTFCRIVDRTEPSEVILETSGALVFMDALPMTPGHCLVIPKVHRRDVLQMEPGDAEAVFSAVRIVGERISERLGAKGLNVITNCGSVADQSQFHVHFHVVPRYGGDRLLHPWERRFGDWTEIGVLAAKLR
jgi:histidine triad (HIT) family protein